MVSYTGWLGDDVDIRVLRYGNSEYLGYVEM
jgi:hypothetical protein